MSVNKGNTSIVLFDGECNFCNSSIYFIIRHDKKNQFRFATLQSEIGKSILKKYTIHDATDSIVLIEKDKVYSRSTAVLHISKHLNGAYSLLYVFIVIPPFIRNFTYDVFSRNRTKWFGKRESCMI